MGKQSDFHSAKARIMGLKSRMMILYSKIEMIATGKTFIC